MADVSVTFSMDGDIEVSDIDDMAEELSKIIDTTVTSEELRPKLQTLQTTAKEFQNEYHILINKLNNITYNYERIAEIEQAMAASANNEDADLTPEIESYNNKIKETTAQIVSNSLTGGGLGEQLYSSVFKFQAALNDFFNQKMILTIVYKEKVYTVEEADYSKYLQYSLHDGDVSARFNNLRKLITNLDMAEWTDPGFLESQGYDLSAVQNVAHGKKSALWRYNRSQGIIKSFAKADNKQSNYKGGGLILWHRPSWIGAWVNNRGDIAEAYASIILDRNATNNYTNSDIDSILDDFIQNVLNVDATSGVLQGDYSTGGGLEYAIKSSRASALGYTQFNEIANIVLSNDFSPTLIKEWADKQVRTSNGRSFMIKDLQSIAKEDLLDALEKGATAK